MDKKPTMTAAQAAMLLGVSHDTINRMYHRGELQGYKLTQRPNGRLCIYAESVEHYDSQRRTAPQAGI